MRGQFPLWIFLFVSLGATASLAQVEVEVAFPGLSFVRPVSLQSPSDGTNRLFVVEQRGVISVFENHPSVSTKRPFLDIQDHVNDAGNEEGLLGLAFHPDYVSNGRFYVNYTAANPSRTVVAGYMVSATDAEMADPNSEQIILEINQPFSNHNGGGMMFGPDGYLYIGMGDGGSGGDPQGNAQNLHTLLGAMLRIDVDTRSSQRNYGIPPDNPWVGNSDGFREEIYAYGLRNPWRFSFDRVTGWLWAGDVGQGSYEEVDIIDRGRNYGWNIMEGMHCFNPVIDCEDTGLTLPIWEYGHRMGQSITGGFVYRGRDIPALVGSYIYGDYVTGRLWALRYDGMNPVENRELVDTNLGIASFGVDQSDEVYICAFDGKLYRLKPTVSIPPWDVNADGVTDILDLVLVASEFGLQGISLTGDINRDGTVDILDLVLVGQHFNEAMDAAAPCLSVSMSVLEGWLTAAKQVQDGSQAFQHGVSVLESLLVESYRTRLLPNYPNPFNPETWIPYALSSASTVQVRIHNSQGHLVRLLELGYREAGVYSSRDHAAYWDGRNMAGETVASGVYFYTLQAGDFIATRKLIISQ